MKLRQKLAAVLATAMVVTAVPVVTMATATTTLKREVITIEKDKAFTQVTTANAVKVSFDNDAIAGNTDIIYLTLDNAEWDTAALTAATLVGTNPTTATAVINGITNNYTTGVDDTWVFNATTLGGSTNANGATNTGIVIYQKQTDKIMKVVITGHSSNSTQYLPLLATAKGGDAKVTVENKGNGTLSKTNSYIFATTGEKKFKIKADTAKAFYREGELAKLTLEEAFPGSLKNGGQFRIELDDTDYYFDGVAISGKGLYGFGGKQIQPTLAIDSSDKSAAVITIPATQGDGSLGVIELTGIRVRSTSKTPEEGDFLADLKSVDSSMDADMNNVVLGKVTKYSTYIKMKDDKAKDVKAGRIEELEFEVGEGVEDSMISDREFEIKAENGHFDYVGLVKDYYADKATAYNAGLAAGAATKSALDMAKADYADAKFEAGDDCKKLATHIDSVWLANKILPDKGDWNVGTAKGQTNVSFDMDDNKILADTLVVNLGEYKTKGALQNNKEIDKLKFKIKVCVPIDNKAKENVKLTASGRALENEVSTTAINIINPFDVTFTQVNLKVGLQGQAGGTLTLTEKDKDMFQKGEIKFTIKNGDETVGIYLTDVKFDTSASIKGEKTGSDKGAARSAKVTLNRVTKEAGTITFKDMVWTADRTVPEGTYDLEISGAGIDADGHTLKVEDFIKITTTNTQDITANGLAKGKSTFVIGESKYTFEDKSFDMDAPSYIQDPGFTMVPVRYVAKAFGVAEKDIVFGQGTVTIFAGERTISLTNGSNVALVNGNPITMGTAVVIKDGRTYAPASQIASLLGMKSTWDATTKVATFENN